jgi:hypothetical protein
MKAKAAAMSVQGVLNVVDYAQSFSVSPTVDTTLTITQREIATFAAARINVTS